MINVFSTELEDYIKYVKALKEDYSEEIPEEILGSIGGGKYKVRKAWFQCVGGALTHGIKKGFLPSRYVLIRDEFFEWNKDGSFSDRDTKREDVDYANGILETILEEVSQ